MIDSTTASNSDEQSRKIEISHYPEPFLRALAAAIFHADEMNTASWSVFVPKRTAEISLYVESTKLLAVGTAGLYCVVSGRADDPQYAALPRLQIENSATDGIARITNVRLDEFDKVWPIVERGFFGAIDFFGTLVKTRTHRANDHDSELIDLLGQALGMAIPQPSYVGNSKIGRAEASVSTHLRELSAWPRDALEWFAESILRAHSLSPHSWAFRLRGDELSLYVNRPKMLAASPQYAHILVSGQVDTSDGLLRPEQLSPGRSFEYPSTWIANVEPDKIRTVRDAVGSGLEQLIDILAPKTAVRPTTAGSHDQALVESLGRELGIPLPSPTYLANMPKKPASYGHYWLEKVNPATWQEDLESGALSSPVIPSPPVDLRTLPTMREEFIAALAQYPGIGRKNGSELWSMYNDVQIGDRIVAHTRHEILAVGAVTGDYRYQPEADDRKHQRPVEWQQPSDHVAPPYTEKVKELIVGWGLRQLAVEDFRSITGENGGRDDPRLPRPFVDLRHSFSEQGLSYTADQIATFYTALQSKGFVVLSGISGTGKSKIAQGFVDFLPRPDNHATDSLIDPESVISVTVKPYMRNYRRIVIPVKQEVLLPDIEKGKSITLQLSTNGLTEKARLSRRQDTGSLYLYFRQAIGDQVKALDLGQPLYLRPEVSGDEDESLDLIEMFTNPAHLPSDVRMSDDEVESRNSLFLAVRPDWRDSTSLLGYYNPLTETYEWTGFLKFLLRARDDYEQHKKDALAWFVILDEMNLAHVEYYFADLLSIIESGRDEKGWSREPIRLTYPDAKTDNPPPHEIYLPPNVYIIGTVNMDETTHAFSPKVLDRAFTIELTDVDFTGYPPAQTHSGQAITDDQRQALLKAFTRDGTFAQVSKTDIRVAVDNHPEMGRWLQSLNTRLAKDQFHFGYRVFDEIAQFIHNADENGMFVRDGIDPSLAWQEAFDHAVYMKVLPKFNGSHARLIGPLNSLLDWARNPDAPMDGQAAAQMASLEQAGEDAIVADSAPKLNRVATRVEAMIKTLEANGFVSFG